jgi:hypothetical protein
VGRSAWMPSERRWAMDGPSARAHTTVPERGDPCEAGAVRQRITVSPFAMTKGVDRQGENQSSQTEQMLLAPHNQKHPAAVACD